MNLNDEEPNPLAQMEGAAGLYAVTADDIGHYRDMLACCGPIDLHAYVSGGLHAALTRTALDHRTECDGTNCRTCNGLHDALALAVASVRTLVDVAGRGRTSAKPRLFGRSRNRSGGISSTYSLARTGRQGVALTGPFEPAR